MMVYWFFLAALAAVNIIFVRCDTRPERQNERTDDTSDLLGALFGFRPCLDESCENYAPETPGTEASDYQPPSTETDEHIEENPRVHCIMLKPNAVNTFGEIEKMHPGISDIKYRVLEDLIDHMYPFATLELENCQPAMKLIDLIILAGNSLKTRYILQGGENCTYRESKNKGGLAPDYVTEMPCNLGSTESSEYVTGEPTLCPGSTIKPPVEIPSMPEEQKPAEEPCLSGSTEYPCKQATKEPVQKICPDGVTTEQPCPQLVDSVTEEYSNAEIEIIAEDEKSEDGIPFVGSVRGIPGVHYPNYSEIPITSFTCADKKYIPGFYADLDTGCQVFHVCYEHRRESFLCPVGTVFNQPILACDYWYSSNCSLAPHYYDVNQRTELKEEKIDEEVEQILTLIAEDEKSKYPEGHLPDVESDLDKITPFFPIKAVVTDIKVPIKPTTRPSEEVASEIVDEMATKATKIISSTRTIIKSIPEPAEQKPVFKPAIAGLFPVFKKPMKMDELLSHAVIPLAKAKLAAIPVSKLTALKTVVPVASLAAKTKVTIPVIAAKAKLATKVAAIPAIKFAATAPLFAKTKLAAAAVPAAKVAVAAPVISKVKFAAVPAAKMVAAKAALPVVAKVASVIPKAAVKSTIPAIKGKMIASAVPLAKSKIVPLMKAKVVKSAGTPLLKAKMLALPLAKGKLGGPVSLAKFKLAKAAAISPLTKKALALGYMKLLKAKKIALMG